MASFVDSVMLASTVVVPPATWAATGPALQSTPAAAIAARARLESFFFMMGFLGW
jgi:hypothetical protein